MLLLLMQLSHLAVNESGPSKTNKRSVVMCRTQQKMTAIPPLMLKLVTKISIQEPVIIRENKNILDILNVLKTWINIFFYQAFICILLDFFNFIFLCALEKWSLALTDWALHLTHWASFLYHVMRAQYVPQSLLCLIN